MKCRYCGIELNSDPYRNIEHVKICKNVTPETRYINSGIMQKGYDKETNTWERQE